jgi:multidrug efflux pump subunit AcrA (membrane-fusion protein)
MDKIELQQEIEKKNQELISLKSEILALQQNQVQKKEELEQKKLQLEEEKNVLEEQLEELENIETDQQVTQTQEETEDLKDNISLETYSTNELIKDSSMYNKLLEIGKTPEEIEVFGNSIDATVKKYLDQELIGFSEEVKNNMSVAIQFSMMDALMKDGQNGADFFESFSGTNTDSGKNVLT